jgi:hypothetical protein
MAKLKAPKAPKLTNPMLQQHTASSSAQMAPGLSNILANIEAWPPVVLLEHRLAAMLGSNVQARAP